MDLLLIDSIKKAALVQAAATLIAQSRAESWEGRLSPRAAIREALELWREAGE